MIDPTTQQQPRQHRRLIRKDPGVASRRSLRRRSGLVGLVLAVLVTTLASVATSAVPAGALSCGDVGSCDVLTVQLTARISGLNSPANNAAGLAALNQAASNSANAGGNAHAAWYYGSAAYYFHAVIGDPNNNGSKDLDEASLYLLFYRNAADRNSAQARTWLDWAEQIVKNAEFYNAHATNLNAYATIVSNLWNNNWASPAGTIDAATPTYNVTTGRFDLRVTGWAIDPDTADPITVSVSVGNSVTVTAKDSRPDVGAAYPPYGANHGYTATVPFNGVGPAIACVKGTNVGPGATRNIACRAVDIPADWTRTNLQYHIGGQDISEQLPSYINPWATGANSSQVRCTDVPTVFVPPSIPIGKASVYDCRRAGTVDRAGAKTALGFAGYGQFLYDAGQGKDGGTAWRAEVDSGSTGGYGDPKTEDALNPNLPPSYNGAWGVISLANSYTKLSVKIYRATKFRQFYGVGADGKVWAWKVQTAQYCERRTLKAILGIPFEWSTTPTAC